MSSQDETNEHNQGDSPDEAIDASTYDVIVVGAGPTGENVADYAHRGGLRVVVVEAELVGGECSYWACMPSKALLRPGQARRAALSVAGSTASVTGVLDVAAVLARRDSFASHWDDAGQVGWLHGVPIDLVRGHGRLAGELAVQVTASDATVTRLQARHAVVLATGTRASVPGIPGLAEARPWTSRHATSAKGAPEHLVVLGGGVVGVEMATAWSDLGSKVTVLSATPLLPRNEPVAGELVTAALRERGVEVRIGVTVSGVGREVAGGPVRVEIDGGDSVVGSELLVAVGRTPQSDDLGLERVGLTPGGYVEVDDTLRVKGVEGDWLYAAGDLNGRALLTHMGKYQGRVSGSVIAARAAGEQVHDKPWGRHVATADHDAVPQVVFTDPQVGAAGVTAKRARAAGLPVRVVEIDLATIAGASLEADGYTGRVVAVIDSERRVLVGMTFVGPDVAEMVHAASIAIVGEVPLDRLWHAVPSYPTVSEVWLRVLEAYLDLDQVGRPA